MITKITLQDLFTQLTQLQQDRRPEMTAAFSSNVALALLATTLRMISRRIIHAPLQADDYTIILALTITVIEYSISMYGLTIGAGRHSLLVQDPMVYAKVVLSLQCLYIAGTWLVKTSILLLYRRLFGCNKRLNRWIWGILGFVFADHLCMILLSIFSCRPVQAVWNPMVKGWCVNVTVAAIIFGSINVVIDVVLLVLPIPLVWRLKIQRKWRIQLVGVFLLGGFVCLGSIYRTTTLRRFATHDPAWNDVDPAIWAIVENSMGIVSACLPTLRPLFTLLIKGHRCSIASGQCSICQARASTPFNKGSSGADGWMGGKVAPQARSMEEKKGGGGVMGAMGGKNSKIGFEGPFWSRRRTTPRFQSEAIPPLTKPPPGYSQSHRQYSARIPSEPRRPRERPSRTQPFWPPRPGHRPSPANDKYKPSNTVSRSPWWVPYNSFAPHNQPSPPPPQSSHRHRSHHHRHHHHRHDNKPSPQNSNKRQQHRPKQKLPSSHTSWRSKRQQNEKQNQNHETENSHDTERTLVSETGPPTPPKDSPYDSFASGKQSGGSDEHAKDLTGLSSSAEEEERLDEDLEAAIRGREDLYRGVPFIEIF